MSAQIVEENAGQVAPRRSVFLAGTSVLFSVATFACWHLYVRSHWKLFFAGREGGQALEEAQRAWAIFGHFKLVSIPLAVIALVLAILAQKRGPYWLWVVALVLSLLACATIPLAT
jgi:hypothetical protein